MIDLSKKYFCFVLPAFIFLYSCGGKNEDAAKTKSKESPAIEGHIVKPQTVQDHIEVSGALLPAEEAVLMPEVGGRITMLNLPEGKHVTKGTLLVKLFDADLRAELAKLQSQLTTAKTVAGRQKELVAINGISQLEYEQSLTTVAGFEADIAAVNAQLSKTEIRAPFNGTIGLRKISEGAFVSAGTALATIRSDQQLKLDFSIPESYAAQIDKNTNIQFSVAGDTSLFSATVIATEQNIESGSRNLHVRAQVNSADKKLVPGASANVEIGFGIHENAVLVPSESIIPQARFKTVIVSRNGKAEFVKVQTGIRTPSSVEIISGIKPGDTIVTTGIQFVRPGSALKFSSVK
ncbi:MAG: efflux RND transporter periplasmic adaptor subunit [Bacteroidia bacterium]